jgi:hypothetical protein
MVRQLLPVAVMLIAAAGLLNVLLADCRHMWPVEDPTPTSICSHWQH